MDPKDSELKKALKDGPPGQRGFDENLKRRIEERLDEPRVRRRPWRIWAGAAGAACALAAGLLFAGAYGLVERLSPKAESSAMPAAADPAQPAEAETGPRTALLVGTRTDRPAPSGQKGQTSSVYRSFLLAPEGGRLEMIASGKGILMPYKMEFWRIDGETAANGSTMLGAVRVASNGKTPLVRSSAVRSQGNPAFSEKLLFAGNRYVAIAQTPPGGREMLWVKELPQLAAPRRSASAEPLQEPHVTLRSLLGESAQPLVRSLDAAPPGGGHDTVGESWTLERRQGNWTAMLASYDGSGPNGYRLKDVPADLPDALVSYDTLSTPWAEVSGLQPAATDAFTSPNLDMAVVVTPRSLVVHPMHRGELIASPLLTVPLAENETVVMTHWALDPYIDQWKRQAKAQLSP
ncbi:hypothetical protein [Paenibacillus mucilaginosus]|uniref:Uncharacterized protein n=1 Tax=Paenibacillus mucilaginosus (strain KNP414) TaxID=1036673 RepID=F8FP31_PAEMK|nr:hypothetical protein [Paenibacillus mucilaginosus]AEI45810.1 hypothetical protein KNP414_07300 [Paenibacillus mucilaginosus KNP414]MCG7215009.1 hypothetical protein [Paenibacillus mucilaginosus]WDM27181.1 hypothetical protein KCX80_33105 [Paenibacillus mucilaginosus]